MIREILQLGKVENERPGPRPRPCMLENHMYCIHAALLNERSWMHAALINVGPKVHNMATQSTLKGSGQDPGIMQCSCKLRRRFQILECPSFPWQL
jgi:hypothetical protein